jgi:hypothetical protein
LLRQFEQSSRVTISDFRFPSTGVINFITSAFNEKSFSIYVYTTLGQKVYEKTNLITKESELNLSKLKGGTYFIMFSNDEKTITKTIILK